ncbi:MAG: hypothetical protein RIG77_16330 [Cyclobacteriaceae bacterium]
MDQLLNKLTFILIALFILSAVTEKLVDLIRKYPHRFRILALFILPFLIFVATKSVWTQGKWEWWILDLMFLSLLWFDINVLFFNKGKEWWNLSVYNPFQNTTKDKVAVSNSTKKRQITILGICLGVMIAFAFQASFFEIFNGNTQLDNLSFGNWEFELITNDWVFNEHLAFDFKEFIGILATGFFLSFGSQFFHDLLDYVLEIKNSKRKLNDPQLYQTQTIAGFDEYRQMVPNQEASMALKENNYILKLPNVLGAFPGINIDDGQRANCIEIHLKDDDVGKISSSLPFKLSDGQVINVPTYVIPNVTTPTVHFQPGDTLTYNPYKSIGSFGLVLKDIYGTDSYILTCSHVMNDGFSTADQGTVNVARQFDVVEEKSKKSLGHLFYEIRNARYDVALIKTNKDLKNKLTKTKSLANKVFTPSIRDVADRTEVIMKGGKSKRRTGVIQNINVDYEIKYADKTVTMKGLIVVAKWLNGWNSISQSGDSGSVVYNVRLEPMGIVLGGNAHFTFVIPIDRILDKTDTQIA